MGGVCVCVLVCLYACLSVRQSVCFCVSLEPARAKWRRAEGCRFRAGRASMRAGRRLLCRCLPRMAHTRPRTHPPHTPRLPTSPAISVSDMPSRVHLDRTSDHATCSAPRTPLPASAARVQQLIPRRARLQSELRPGPLPFHAGDGRGNRRVSKAHHPLRTRSTPSLCAACLNILARVALNTAPPSFR